MPVEHIKDNWEKRIEKLKKITELWSKRNITLTGKIVIIKSMLILQTLFPMTVMDVPQDIIKLIETLLFKFLWGKKEKVIYIKPIQLTNWPSAWIVPPHSPS